MKIIIRTFIALLLTWIAIGSPFIFGDGYGYYHAGKVLATTGEFTTQEKPDYFNYTGHGVVAINGEYITPYPSGNALMWFPLLKTASVFDSGTIYNDYYKAFNGHSIADGVAISLSAILFASLSIFIIFKSLLLLKFGAKLSYFSSITTFLSTLALAYTLINASYSHIYEIFIFSAIVYLCLKIRDSQSKNIRIKPLSLWLIGILSGILFLVRPFDILLLIPIGIYLLKTCKFKTLYLIIGGIPFLLIFFAYNLASYGSILKTGYSLSEGFIFVFNIDRLVQLLFSDIRGWYVYSPLMFLSTVGLLVLVKRNKNLILLTLLPVIVLILGYSFWQNWWAGDSIGQRFLLVLIPIMSIGTAQIMDRLKHRKILITSIVLICTCYSILVLGLIRFTPTDKIGTNRQDYQYINSYERFGVSDILKYHWNLVIKSKNPTEYFQDLQKGLSGGRSIGMIWLGLTKPIIQTASQGNDIFLYIIPTPTNSKTDSQIQVSLTTEQGTKIYQISGLDSSIYSQLVLNCVNTCSTSNTDLKEVGSDFDNALSQEKEFTIPNGKVTISVNDSLKLIKTIRE